MQIDRLSGIDVAAAAADGITAQDITGRLLYANQSAAEMSGFSSPEEMLSAEPEEILARFELLTESGEPLSPTELPGRRAARGETPPEMTLRFRVKATGEERWSQVSSRPVLADDGVSVLYAVNVFRDVTAQKMAEKEKHELLKREKAARAEAERARDQLEFLSLASATLFSSLNYPKTLERVARAAVPDLCDWCGLDLLDDSRQLRRLVVVHKDPDKVRLAQEYRDNYPPDPESDAGAFQVARTGEPLLIPEVTEEMIRAAVSNEEQADLILGLGLVSAMVVPLKAGDRVLGTLSMISAESGVVFGEDDLKFAEELARRAAMAIQNALAYEQRSRIARALERSLLPADLPNIPGLELASRFLPAGDRNEVGGDFYDVFRTGTGKWALVVGDVRGKGPEAAALTGLVRHTIRNEARHDEGAAAIMDAVNVALIDQHMGTQFCALGYAVLEPGPGGFRIEGQIAGLPLPLRVSGGEVTELGHPGLLLGVIDEVDHAPFEGEFRTGDSLVFLTDGVTDTRRDRHVFGDERLHQVLAAARGASADETARRVVEAVTEFGGTVRHDDLALLIARAV